MYMSTLSLSLDTPEKGVWFKKAHPCCLPALRGSSSVLGFGKLQTFTLRCLELFFWKLFFQSINYLTFCCKYLFLFLRLKETLNCPDRVKQVLTLGIRGWLVQSPAQVSKASSALLVSPLPMVLANMSSRAEWPWRLWCLLLDLLP